MKKLALLAALGLSLQTSAQPIDWLHPKFVLVRSDGGVFGTLVVNQETAIGISADGGVFGTISFGSEVGNGIQVGFVDAGIIAFGAGSQMKNAAGSLTINGLSVVQGDTGQDIQSNGLNPAFYAPNGDLLLGPTIGTQASGTGITANYSGRVRSFVHKVTVINTALAAAATSDVTLAITPANTRIIRVTADVTQVFTGGALSAMTVQCGNSAGGTQYLLANSVFTAQNTWGDVQAEVGAGLLTATWADFGTSAAGVPGAITVQCRFTCTGANCSAATQGSVTFYVEGVTY